jgi:hypothetical protein
MSPTSYRAALFRGIRVDGVEGFEPSDDGTKSRCLTAWRYPNHLSGGIIVKKNIFVKAFLDEFL